MYYPDDGSPQWCRLLNGSNWLPWYQLSTKKDVSNAINKFDLSKIKFHNQYINGNGDKVDKTWSATKNDDGTYTIDLYNDDWTASKLHDVLTQLPNKADKNYVDNQIASIDFGKIKFRKQYVNSDGDKVDKTWSATKNDDGTYTIDLYNDDWTASKLADVLMQLPNKADESYVDSKVAGIDFSKIKFRKQYVTYDDKAADSTWQATKNADGTYTIDLYHDDWTAQRVVYLLNQIGSKANASDVNSLQNLINQQNQTIQSLTSRLTNAENEINYIKANYVEGRTFPASQEAQANSWENENPQRIAFIER